jgi:hypothetical protein
MKTFLFLNTSVFSYLAYSKIKKVSTDQNNQTINNSNFQ